MDFICEAIERGHEWALDWMYPGVFTGAPVTSPQTVSEVCDVLDMWSMIERSYAKLSKEEEKQVEVEAEPFGKNVRFQGFSVNDEITHYSIADFLINKMGRFDTFEGRELNSHFPCLDAYRRMLTVFKPRQHTLVGRCDLSVTEIIDVLKEMTHPTERKR